MATFYLDYEGGNDANDGTTFANRWKTFAGGATAPRTAPGDTILIMGSPAPTSLGINGTWTSGVLQATKTLTAATNATPIAITITGHGYSTGDTVVVTGVVGNTNANGTWEITVTDANTFTLDNSAGNAARTSGGTVRLRNNTRVKLASALTQNIASTGPGRAAWTQSANVTTALDTNNFKEHRDSDSIAIAAGFTTGLAAYWPTGSINLSGYQQVSFWIRQTTGTVGAAGAVDLRLCSDNAGVTAVNTISIPNLVVTGRWMPVTVDLATNLGSSIQSIALYVNTDNGAQTFLLSNIIACKASSAADSLTLTSLIGKNTTGETFWGIQSINGTRVMLDAETGNTPTSTSVRGYYGTSETVTTHKRETIKLTPVAASTTAIQSFAEDGSATAGHILYSGGWDRTNMSTQNTETWLDGQNGLGYMFSFVNRSFITIEKFGIVRCFNGVISTNQNVPRDHVIDLVAANNISGTAIDIGAAFAILKIDHCVANASIGLSLTSSYTLVYIGHGILSCVDYAISTGTAKTYIYPKSSSYKIANIGQTVGAITPAGQHIVNGAHILDNAGPSVRAPGIDGFANNCLLNDTTEVSVPTGANGYYFSQNHDQTANNHKVFVDGGLISSATDQRNTASGISWKMQPTSANRNASWPVVLSLAKVACAANALVTVKAYMRRDSTGLTMRLVCKGGQLTGVASNVVSTLSAAVDTWAEQTITFTPTEVGVVEITVEAFGGTTHSGWVDDMTISQA